jgi:hypothetical protein
MYKQVINKKTVLCTREITAIYAVAAAKYRSPSSKTVFEKCSTEIMTM